MFVCVVVFQSQVPCDFGSTADLKVDHERPDRIAPSFMHTRRAVVSLSRKGEDLPTMKEYEVSPPDPHVVVRLDVRSPVPRASRLRANVVVSGSSSALVAHDRSPCLCGAVTPACG